MASDPAVVADVYHVVELGAFANPRHPESSAVHTGVGSDLDAVAQFDPSHLRKLFVSAVREHESEAVRSDHTTGMEDDMIADGDIVVHGHCGVEETPGADAHMVAYGRAWTNSCGFANLDIVADGDEWSDGNAMRRV